MHIKLCKLKRHIKFKKLLLTYLSSKIKIYQIRIEKQTENSNRLHNLIPKMKLLS